MIHTQIDLLIYRQHHCTFPKCSFLPMTITQQLSHHVLTGCCLHHLLLYVLIGKALQTCPLLFFLFLPPVIIILLSLPPKYRKPRLPIAIFNLRLPQDKIFFFFFKLFIAIIFLITVVFVCLFSSERGLLLF